MKRVRKVGDPHFPDSFCFSVEEGRISVWLCSVWIVEIPIRRRRRETKKEKAHHENGEPFFILSQICVTCDTERYSIVCIFYHIPMIFSIGKVHFLQ